MSQTQDHEAHYEWQLIGMSHGWISDVYNSLLA